MQKRPEPSAREWLARLNAFEISSVELVNHYLARIDSVNPTLNAVVSQNRSYAIESAKHADSQRRKGNVAPLLGMPVTVKDALEAKGFVAACGSFAREGFVPPSDATVVDRLRRAGAIIIGKTNVPEYCWGLETDNLIYGRTNNPLDVRRTPGGSSGGEAAILGADASIVGIGSDGGASIRVPAHYCGIVGLRPTAGRVPDTGHWPTTRASGTLDVVSVGPLARYVGDLALVLEIIAGPDDVDPFAVPVPTSDWRGVDVRQLRVAFYPHDGFSAVTEGTRQAVEAAAEAMRSAGCEVTADRPAALEECTELFFMAMAADGGAAALRDLVTASGRHTEAFQGLLRNLEPLATDAAGVFDVFRRIFRVRERVRKFVRKYDVVISPVAAGPAPEHGVMPGASVGHTTYDAINYTHVYSLAGLPVVTVPIGEEQGMPISVQVAAGPFREHVAVAAAALLEDSFGGFAGVRQR